MASQFPLSARISAFVRLGERLLSLGEEEKNSLFIRAQNQNAWFTFRSLEQAVEGVRLLLSEEALTQWVDAYQMTDPVMPKSIGLLMAGNIPAVGFHDLLAVLISGNVACVKLSSTDAVLLLWLMNELHTIEPRFAERIQVEEMLKNKEAYIATGSNNSARYFNYYFGKFPHVIRANRSSVAVLSGQETEQDLAALGKDIFDYFGLGCRNVSKVFVKDPAQLTSLLDALSSHAEVAAHHKYLNNYEYNKSIYLVNREPHLDNGFLLLRESTELVSPIGVLFYEVYADEASLASRLAALDSQIQCIVGDLAHSSLARIPFGQTQCPAPWDYADGVDTLDFLLSLRPNS
jgi:hypothetical protein